MLKITILYGAIREGRLSIRAARAIDKALRDSGKADVTFIDVKDYDLPLMENRLKDMKDPLPDVVKVGKMIEDADGLIFVTPEYNNSYSGPLKNTVDYYTKEWGKKPIGIVCGSNGKQGGINASNLLQLLVLAIGAFPMPRKLLVPELDKSLDENGNPQNETMANNLDRFVKEYLWFAEAIVNHKRKEQ